MQRSHEVYYIIPGDSEPGRGRREALVRGTDGEGLSVYERMEPFKEEGSLRRALEQRDKICLGPNGISPTAVF